MLGSILEKLLAALCAMALVGATGCAAQATPPKETPAPPDDITVGTELQRGFRDQHTSGQAFVHGEEIMDWLFSLHSVKPDSWHQPQK